MKKLIALIFTTLFLTLGCVGCSFFLEDDRPDQSTCQHLLSKGNVTVEPTCLEDGEFARVCRICGYVEYSRLEKLGHDISDWIIVKEPTFTEEGFRQKKCKRCDHYVESETLEIIPTLCYITTDDGQGNVEKVNVGYDGAYSLTQPKKVGYKFMGWKTADGEAFPENGTTFEGVSVYGEWELDGTNTLEELIERAEAGVDRIDITADIVVSSPIYFVGKTELYSSLGCSLIRDPNYRGDMLVIGQTKAGKSSAMLHLQTELSIGKTGELTIDGNRDGINEEIVGSALYVSDSSTVNLYDGITVKNNRKDNNSRTLKITYYLDYAMKKVGGAAIAIINGTVNMYGGTIENNSVLTEYTEVTDELGVTAKEEYTACGGAIYNNGNFNMYGGVIQNNEALRGGAIYNNETVYLVSGSIINNRASVFGGAIATSSSAENQTVVGYEEELDSPMTIDGNHSDGTGGALYSNTNSPIMILGNAVISNNSSTSSGGAIYTAGGLTVRNTSFISNSSQSSGGAIYYLYSKPEYARRHLDVKDSLFEGNTSTLGGAIILSARDECEGTGAFANITGCTFKQNSIHTSGNGGAIYVTRQSVLTLTDCIFDSNSSVSSAGALSVHRQSTVELKGVSFTSNTANTGGAIYANDSTLVLSGVDFTSNSSTFSQTGNGGNGGAGYFVSASISLSDVTLNGNSADGNGGGFYQNNVTLTLDDTVEFISNSAKNHGGALYLTYTTNEDGTKSGSSVIANGTKFENNTALSGGAISARTASTLDLTSTWFNGNATPEAKVSQPNGGGAIYSNNSDVTLVSSVFSGNSSGYYGGALKLEECQTSIVQGEISESDGGTGGAIYAKKGSLSVDGLILLENSSTLNGVIYLAEITSELENLSATDNSAVSGGVAFISSDSEVKFEKATLDKNTATNGGAIYSNLGTTLIIESTLNQNEATNGGAIFASNGGLELDGLTSLSQNHAVKGGAIALDGSANVLAEGTDFYGNTATNGGAISATNGAELSVTNVRLESNQATEGGAIYLENGAIGSLIGASLSQNTAKYGGAVASTLATVSIEGGRYRTTPHL